MPQIRSAAVFLLLALVPAAALATEQLPELIQKSGKMYFLLDVYPLETHFEKIGSKPKLELTLDGKRTSSWRGYVATWEISDGALYLKDVHGFASGEKVKLSDLFPSNSHGNERIEATWFSGKLLLSRGFEMIRLSPSPRSKAHTGVHLLDSEIEIVNGKIIGVAPPNPQRMALILNERTRAKGPQVEIIKPSIEYLVQRNVSTNSAQLVEHAGVPDAPP